MSQDSAAIKKDLMRYLLTQVKAKQLPKEEALSYLKVLDSDKAPSQEPIAVIGLACRFPQADNQHQFWENLCTNRNSIRPFPDSRFKDLTAAETGKEQLFDGGFLEDVSRFDAEYFNIPPAVALQMDPYHRLLLQSFVETTEDAGYSRQHIQGTHLGVFVGNDHAHRFIKNYLDFVEENDFNSMTGSWTAVLASRISYLLNLRGPAVVVDTSCSSGLVAIDYAVKALQSGDCDSALVGTTNILFAPIKGTIGDVENDDFMVRTFDNGASGTTWGEGVASIMLKPLSAAQKAGDSIYGVIRSIAVNNDGASNGITAPNARAQQEVLLAAWKKANVNVEDIDYIESHGTGTHLGDPIEIRGLSNAFAKHTQRKQFVGIGSVKTNIGHTVGSAGLASLIKVLLSMRYQKLPASLNFEQPNLLIDFCNSPVYINDELSAWPERDTPRIAGVSSFSLSGTNCHLVLQEPPKRAPATPNQTAQYITISARTPELMQQTMQRLAHFVQQQHAVSPSQQITLQDISFTLANGREHHPWRLMFACHDLQELHTQLGDLLAQWKPLIASAGNISATNAAAITLSGVSQPFWFAGPEQQPDSLSKLDKAARVITQALGENTEMRPATADEWHQIAPLYVLGGRIEWQRLFASKGLQRAHLPAQPFAEQRFWFTPTHRPVTQQVEEETLTPQQELQKLCTELAQAPCVIADLSLSDDTSQALAQKILAYAVSNVLGYENLTSNDDLYNKGGDSIAATRIVQMVNDNLGLDIPVSDLLAADSFGQFIAQVCTDYPVASALQQALSGESLQANTSPQTAITDAKDDVAAKDDLLTPEVAPESYFLPLSKAQQRMHTLAQLTDGSTAYNVNGLVAIDSLPDLAQMKRATEQLVLRHESLRTRFVERDDELQQEILPNAEVSLTHQQLEVSGDDVDAAIQQFVQDFIQPFDLTQAPLMRVGFASTADQQHFMIIDMHHIITDGSSMGILIADYAQLFTGQTLAHDASQYSDFTLWHNELLASDKYQQQRNYWLERYATPVDEAQLPIDFVRPKTQDYRGQKQQLLISKERTAQIKQHAQHNGVTLFMWLNAAMRVLMHKYAVTDDLVLGTPVAGRPTQQWHSTIGMFVNTLALRLSLNSADSFGDLLKQVKQQTIADFAMQDYPYESLVEELALPRNSGRNPLFDIYFVLQNEDMGLEGSGVRLVPTDTGTAKFDLTVICRELINDNAHGLSIDWEFATSLFDPLTITRMSETFDTLINALLATDSTSIAELDIIPAAHKQFMLSTLNDTQTDYSSELSLAARFEQHVSQRPNATALRFVDKNDVANECTLTYQALDNAAAALAEQIKAALSDLDTLSNAQQTPVVGLYLPRRPIHAVAILAVLKLGFAYLPIDAENPLERNLGIIDDSKACLVLTHADQPQLPELSTAILDTTAFDLDAAAAQASDTFTPIRAADGESLAYLMYTSGTTGKPKGAQIRQKSVARVVVNTNYLHLSHTDICFMASSFAFDGCILDLYGALLNGGCLVFSSKKDVLDLALLAQTYVDEKVTSTFLTTSLFNVLIDSVPEQLQHMRYIMFGGEAASMKHSVKAKKLLPNCTFVNGYGPTETTVFAASHSIDHRTMDYAKVGHITIGKPLSNTQIYVLDEQQQLVPFGGFGELYIGGDGVMSGYLQRPDLNEQVLQANPFTGTGNLYRSGDKVRLMPCGNVQYVERIGQQVKVRGFRIELEEIRTALTDLVEVTDAAVIVSSDEANNKQILAYVVLANPELATVSDVSKNLRQRLPDYMVPAAITAMAQLPLNNNGKLDRNALPAPEFSQAEIVEARTPLEGDLQSVWQRVLNQNEVSVIDNFFTLGGDSIKAIQVVTQLRDAGYDVNTSTLFAHQTIEALAEFLGTLTPQTASEISQEPITGEVALSPIQRWFLQRGFNNTESAEFNHFNQSMWIPQSQLPNNALPSEAQLHALLEKLSAHHDMLRAQFTQTDGEWRCEIQPTAQWNIHTAEAATWLGDSEHCVATQKSTQLGLAIDEAKLISITRCEATDSTGQSALCIAIHHLVVDVVSWTVLLNDLNRLLECADLTAMQDVSLSNKTHSVQEWNQALIALADSDQVLDQAEHWADVIDEPRRELSTSDALAGTLADCNTQTVRLDEQSTKALQGDAHQAFNTETQHLLLSALSLACDQWRGAGNTLINLESYGREPLYAEGSENAGNELDVSRTVGWFTTAFPVLLSSNDQLDERIKHTKETLRSIPGKGRDYGLLAYLSQALDPEFAEELQTLSPDIGFNFLGRQDTQSIRALPRHIVNSGKLTQHLLLDLVVSIEDEQLVIEAVYDTTRISDGEATDYLTHYQQALQDIIAFCCGSEAQERTASDFTTTQIKQDEYAEILDDIFD